MKKIISTSHAPSAIGPYSQAVQMGNMLFVSGSLPVDPKSGEVVLGSIKEQTQKSLENIKAIVESTGLKMSDIVKTTVFMQDLAQFVDMNEVYGGFFSSDMAPARSTIQVSKLPKNVLVEIEAIAVFPS